MLVIRGFPRLQRSQNLKRIFEVSDKAFTTIEFASQFVEVPAGGYYDRYRMNPDLNEVAKDAAAGNIDFFRRFPKQQLASRLGPLWAPNFYYRTGQVQLLLLAPMSRLKAAVPVPLAPIRAIPGYGLVALTFFTYSVCDNDPYDEVSIAVVIRRPGARGSQALELLDSMRRKSFHGHVLALPVTTEIARVRGVHAYQLPKWRGSISVQIDKEVRAQIASPSGQLDLSLSAPCPTLNHVPSQSRLTSTTMVNQIDGVWHQATVQSNVLTYAERFLPKDASLQRGNGPMSQLLNGLGASRILRMDVVKDAQLVLNLPIRAPAVGTSNGL